MDTRGIESLPFRPVWTAVDAYGRRLEIYGSEGWGFESLRACFTQSVAAQSPAVRIARIWVHEMDSGVTTALNVSLCTGPGSTTRR
jgi:hypothetical protein